MTYDQHKRRFWQIHLSTAVIVMLVAGGFLYLNTLPVFRADEFIFGWPYRAGTTSIELIKAQESSVRNHCFIIGSVGIYWPHMVYNISIALSSILTAGILSEWRICRRNKRQTLALRPSGLDYPHERLPLEEPASVPPR